MQYCSAYGFVISPLNFKKLHPVSITKIEEIMYAIHEKLSKKRLREKYVGRKLETFQETIVLEICRKKSQQYTRG